MKNDRLVFSSQQLGLGVSPDLPPDMSDVCAIGTEQAYVRMLTALDERARQTPGVTCVAHFVHVLGDGAILRPFVVVPISVVFNHQ